MMRHSTVRKTQSGVAAVELGLLLVVLIPLVFGISEYGRAMYQYNALGKAVRTGSRYLSQYAAGDNTAIGNARCLVAYGNTGCNGAPLVPGLDTSNMSSKIIIKDSSNDSTMKKQPITANGVTVGVANLVRVTVSAYEFTSAVTLIAPSFTFNSISVTMTQALP
jgi:Flp pilus assembly protein TadG